VSVRRGRQRMGRHFTDCEVAIEQSDCIYILSYQVGFLRIALYCIVLYCIVLSCIVLYCIVLSCIVLYCIVLYYVALYYIVLCIAYCVTLCISYHSCSVYILKKSNPQPCPSPPAAAPHLLSQTPTLTLQLSTLSFPSSCPSPAPTTPKPESTPLDGYHSSRTR
jgi:hypothetical protein